MKPQVKHFFDPGTWTLTYVVWDPETRDAVVVDPVLNLNYAAGATSRESVDSVLDYVRSNDLKVHWILETHAHADHLTGAALLKEPLKAKTVIGAKIQTVQQTFAELFEFTDFPADGRQFDRLVKHGEEFSAGSLPIKVFETPGHTPACSTYKIGDALFTGDAIFMPDSGTGRCDFPGGSAKDLYHSIHEVLYKLDDSLRIFVGHDYQPGGRELAFETSIGEQKKKNIQLKAETTEAEFVEFRSKRDATLDAPKLLLPSLQVNITSGHFVNGPFLKIPVKGPGVVP